MNSILELQTVIGYTFHNTNLLKQAMTHSSYANEMKWKKGCDNERLEFLGDSILELVSSEFLYHKYTNKPEGDLTKMRASMVCETALAYCARQIHLGSYLLLGRGEELTGGRERDSLTSDAMEALIGAIYLDGGFTSAKEYIERFILSDMDKKQLFYDSKTILQEIVQGKHLGVISYRMLETTGPEHCKCFETAVFIDEKEMGHGKGHSKKNAEQEAAYHTILQLRQE